MTDSYYRRMDCGKGRISDSGSRGDHPPLAPLEDHNDVDYVVLADSGFHGLDGFNSLSCRRNLKRINESYISTNVSVFYA